MLRNYFVVAIRSLLKNKSYSITNIAGLSIGLAAFTAIFLWILDEVSFDRFHAKSDRIYRVMINDIYPDGKQETYPSPTVLIGDPLRNDIAGIEEVVQTSWNTDMVVKHGDTKFTESGLYADASLFTVFSFPILQGNKSAPISNLNSISISSRLARKLFTNENPVGKTLTLNQENDFIVTSVFAEIPRNSSLTFDFVIPFDRWKSENTWANHWRSGATQAFVILDKKSDFTTIDSKLRNLIKKNCSDCNRQAFLYPFADLYLHGNFVNGKNEGGRISTVFLFGCIAVLILIMACFNFTNLSTAYASTRNQEIGVRKSIGASRLSIVFQYIGESVLTCFLSLAVAVFLVYLLLPLLNDITGKSLSINFGNPLWTGGMLLITILCGILAGLYPAFYLSSLKASTVLKGNTVSPKGGREIRRFLTVAQFTVSIALIICSIVIYRQLNFILKKDLGFNKEDVVVIPQNDLLRKNYQAFTTELREIPAVSNVAFVGSNLFQVPITTTDPVWQGKPANSSLVFKVLRCDAGFIPTMNVKLLAGRNFTNTNSDSSNYIVNQKAMLAMGMTPENVIGSPLQMWNGSGTIVGVTDDFANGNLRDATQPLIMMYSTNNGTGYFIKTIAGASRDQKLARIEAVAKKYAPDTPFEYSFLDEAYNNEYRTETILGKLSLGFTLLAICICCLGLLGLTAFATRQRAKELGIRKVLGASIPEILMLLSKDFIRTVLIAVVLACPIAWYFMHEWLLNFAHRIDISWVIFAVAAIVALLITFITVSLQAMNAATANPVKSLRAD